MATYNPVYVDPAAAQQTVAAAAQPAAYAYTAPAGYAAQPAAYAPAPAYAAYAPPYANPDEVRTVFVTGFPPDVKERELNNLLRFVHGYEASQMHWKNGMAQGFALFAHGEAARAAIGAIHNLVFDDGVVLRCEMARKNMYIRDDSGSAKRGRTGEAAYPPYAPAQAPAPAHAGGGYYASAPAAAPPMQRSYAPVANTKDNPPCNTLFIGNLAEATSEDELRALFAHQPGFRQLKLVRGQRSITCFVEFGDVASAMAVHQSQQGAVLATSDRGGVRIQYSKNPFGKKRDAAGNWISTHEPPPQHAQQPQQAQQAAYVYGGAPYSPGGPAGMAVSPSPGAAAPDSGAYSGMQQQQQFAPAPGVDAAGAPGSYGDGMQQAGGAPQAQGQPAYALQPGAKQEEAGTQQGFGTPPGAQAGGEGADAMANGGLPGLGAAEEPGPVSMKAEGAGDALQPPGVAQPGEMQGQAPFQ